MRPWWARRPARLIPAAVLLGSCVAHPVGPARSYSTYEAKAVTTAESALSAVETGRLTAEVASAGNAFGPYVGTVISEAEESASAVQGTFSSIQPPDDRADALLAELSGLLTSVVDHLTDLRIAARRNELAELDRVAEPLAEDSRLLNQFIDGHK